MILKRVKVPKGGNLISFSTKLSLAYFITYGWKGLLTQKKLCLEKVCKTILGQNGSLSKLFKLLQVNIMDVEETFSKLHNIITPF